MSTILGNCCLLLAALTSRQIMSSVFNYRAPHGGDGGASGYSIWMLLIHVGLLAVLAVAAIAIGAKGGFDWISPNKIIRYFLVAAGLVLAVFMSLVSSDVAIGSETDWATRLSKFALVAIPLCLVLCGFILLNDRLREAVPIALYQWPLRLLLTASVLLAGYALIESLFMGDKNSIQNYEAAEGIKAMRLQEIAESDVENDLVRILEFTGAVYPEEVREKASAKVKTHPDWERKLIELMEDERAIQVFNFLSLNDVSDKKLFLNPVHTGVLYAAYWIRHNIQGTSPSAFRPGMFDDEVNRVLRTVEKFEGQGLDYLPAVQEFRAAFDEPVGGKIMKLNGAAVLDQWIKQRQ
jgi:hypothetical protein